MTISGSALTDQELQGRIDDVMAKNTPKIYYGVAGQSLTLSQIHRKLRKRGGRAKIKGSIVVGIGEGKTAKLVFVRSRHCGGERAGAAVHGSFAAR